MAYQNRETKNKNQSHKSKWSRNHTKTTARNYQYSKSLKKIIKKTEKKSLTKRNLLNLLRHAPNFIGVFASDQLKQCHILHFPTFLIVNLDTSDKSGSHWLCIRIGARDIELFDSLGFDPSIWSQYPKNLFLFLSYYSTSHNVLISPVLQAPNTYICGLFAVYFILYRQNHSFNACIKQFSSRLDLNRYILFDLLHSLS